MAIIIPSKQIYSINNSKILNNKIDVVNVPINIITPSNDYDKTVATEAFSNNEYYEEEFENDDLQGYDLSFIGETEISQSSNIAIVRVTAYAYYTDVVLKIPVLKDNQYIDKLKLGKDEKYDTPNIKFTVYGTLTTEEASTQATLDGSFGAILKIDNAYDYSNPIIEEDISFDEPPYSITGEETNKGASQTITVNITNRGNIATITQPNPTNENGEELKEGEKEFYILNLKILSYVDEIIVSGKGEYVQHYNTENQREQKFALSGTRKRHEAKKIEVTVYGNTVGIDLKEDNLTYGSGNHPLSIDGNELLQDSAIFHALGEDKALSNHLSTSILNRYKKGKETAVILCDMNSEKMQKSYNKNDFSIFAENIIDNVTLVTRTKITIQSVKAYDFKLYIYYTLISISGEKKTYLATLMPNELEYSSEINLIHKEVYIERIETNLTYDISDRVIPMVLGENGKDKPMSINSLGKPKVFEVVGSKKYFDGAVWQELTIQEIQEEEQ